MLRHSLATVSTHRRKRCHYAVRAIAIIPRPHTMPVKLHRAAAIRQWTPARARARVRRRSCAARIAHGYRNRPRLFQPKPPCALTYPHKKAPLDQSQAAPIAMRSTQNAQSGVHFQAARCAMRTAAPPSLLTTRPPRRRTNAIRGFSSRGRFRPAGAPCPRLFRCPGPARSAAAPCPPRSGSHCCP